MCGDAWHRAEDLRDVLGTSVGAPKSRGLVMKRDSTWGGEHTTPYTEDVLQNWTPETYIILLANIIQ